MIKDILFSTIFMYSSCTLLFNSIEQNPLLKENSNELTKNFYYNLTYNYSIFSCGMMGYLFGISKFVPVLKKINYYIENKDKEEYENKEE